MSVNEAEEPTEPNEWLSEEQEIDPCEASSSSRACGRSYFHVGDGLFSQTPSFDFGSILDITHLDLSNRLEREWAWNKIQDEEPKLFIGTTKMNHYRQSSEFDAALHRNYLWKLAQLQVKNSRSFIVSHEKNLDDGISKGLRELFELENVEFLPTIQCERGIMESERLDHNLQCGACRQEGDRDHEETTMPIMYVLVSFLLLG